MSLPKDIYAGRRLAIEKSDWMENWWVAHSPRNGKSACAEGPWEEWVELARQILEVDARMRLEKAEKAANLEGLDQGFWEPFSEMLAVLLSAPMQGPRRPPPVTTYIRETMSLDMGQALINARLEELRCDVG